MPTDPQALVALKPCPHCADARLENAPAIQSILGGYMVCCANPDCLAQVACIDPDRDKARAGAVSRWNTRPTLSPPADAEALARLEALLAACEPFANAAEPIIHNGRDDWQPDEWTKRVGRLNVGQYRAIHAAYVALPSLLAQLRASQAREAALRAQIKEMAKEAKEHAEASGQQRARATALERQLEEARVEAFKEAAHIVGPTEGGEYSWLANRIRARLTGEAA